jgi:hypothetical protein
MQKFILLSNYLPKILFGERVTGETIPKPTFQTSKPTSPLSEFDWMKEFRVSSLHGVQQYVFLGGK